MGGQDGDRKERHSGNPKTSVRAPPKKDGGGGKFTMGRLGETDGGATVDYDDPNYDPEEKRVDPDDGVAYKYEELAAFYKGKFTAQAIAEYWEYECKVVGKRNRKAKDEAGPSLAESAEKAKAEARAEAKKAPRKFSQQELVSKVSKAIVYYPFKKNERYYDVTGVLQQPYLFNAVCDAIASRLNKVDATKLVGFETKGYLFASVAVAARVPFVMLRKKGKIPNSTSSANFVKNHDGAETMCVQKGAIRENDKVVLIDDLLAGGGTVCAAVDLMKAFKAQVVECAFLVEVKELGAREKIINAGASSVWSLVSEKQLNTKGELPDDYVDNGVP